MNSNLFKDTLFYSRGSLIPLPGLFNVFGDVLLLKLAHALNLIEVDYEARVVAVVQPDAFAAKHSQVVAAIEVLHALWVLLAQLLLQ